MSVNHDWLNLIEVSGPFLAVPVLREVLPQGLEALTSGRPQRLRAAYDEWRDAVDADDPDMLAIHSAWVDEVLQSALEMDDQVLRRAPSLPERLKATLPEHGVTITPDLAIVNPTQGEAPLLLIQIYGPDADLNATRNYDGLATTPSDRMVSLLRAAGCPLGLVTNGERWILVHAPVGAVASFACWYARLWGQEPETLRAFVSLLGVRRFFGPEAERLPTLFERSLKHQDDVTDALGEQVRRAVEVLVQSLDRADQDRNRDLLHDVDPKELYEAGLTVMMRLVFLLAAEERGLLLLGDPRYDAFYALSTVDVRWGHYERVPGDEHEVVKTRKNRATGREEETKVKVWRRIPCGGVVPLLLNDGPIRPSTPDRDQPDVRLQGTVRTNDQGERLVTLFLVNGQLEPDDNKDRAWLFQPEISVIAPEGAADKAIFRRRPSNEIVVDDPERDRLALIYRNRLEFAVGHGVSVHADTMPEDSGKAWRVRTEIIPRYEIAVTETPGLDLGDRPAMRRMVDEGWLDMSRLAELEPQALRDALSCLVDDYAVWIEEQRARLKSEITGFDQPGRDVIARCEETLRRLREGMNTLFSDGAALTAFRFANKSMALQRVRSLYALKRRRGEAADVAQLDISRNRSWRPFQLAFLLLSVPSLADPAHPDRTKPVEAFADLLWFPTGGGKTEAYLGVAAFAMAMRRLKNDLGRLDASRGLAVIMRYTLRLLTLQQFQRATALLCAMEVIRRADEKVWGKEPFSLGLWVGNRVTPGRTEDAHQAIEALRNGDRNRAGIASPAQLTSCPWCGSEISAGRDIEVDRVLGRTLIHCGDKLGTCEFSRAGSSGRSHPGLPVKVVDEEIYHRPPTMMIATVDKFAMMAWRPEVRTLFGRVDEECERHGLLWPGHDCGTGHRARGAHLAAKVKPVRAALRPPDLIIQDEFHLISGPLGTMVGLYESAVDELSTWPLGDRKVRPKVVASTATVRRAEDQVRNVFMRRISVFPPSGLDVEDNFFSVQRPIEEKSGRRYMGICAPGSSRPAVLIRTYTAFLTAAQALFDRFGPVADPYMTLVGYFNSLRELGGMKRLAEDDVQTRSFRVNMSLVDRPGLSQRRVDDVRELTSRVSSHDIPRYLDQLEIPFEGTFDPVTAKWVSSRNPGDPRPIDVVLATNMLSVST